MLCTVSLLLLSLFSHQDPEQDDWCDNPSTIHKRLDAIQEQDDWCDNPSTIHKRLDAIQEQLEKTVEHLDSEVKSLLNDVSETAWTKPLAPGTPLIDLFGVEFPDDGLKIQILNFPLPEPAFKLPFASTLKPNIQMASVRHRSQRLNKMEHFIGSSCFQTQHEPEAQDNLEQKLQSDLNAVFSQVLDSIYGAFGQN
ncbi:hypothetical protein E2320_008243 [Naja naja]|nr:hypothetical protein E2320_008243 [Naja naja]